LEPHLYKLLSAIHSLLNLMYPHWWQVVVGSACPQVHSIM
jgi:hypothetical protein